LKRDLREEQVFQQDQTYTRYIMAFQNVRSILSIGSPLSSLKLLPAAASSSRPKYRRVWKLLLAPFVRQGVFSIRYRCEGRFLRAFLRLSDLGADFCSVKELALGDIYKLDRAFHPDLVIDGGGNIGLFTLRAATMTSAHGRTPGLVVCEPLPRNVEQIRLHLAMNGVEAVIVPCCLGGESAEIRFYCRGANQSSFDPSEPYESVIDIPVVSLRSVIDDAPLASSTERILIKLDIEGMEVEVLEAFVPGEDRAVYIVGELHDIAKNTAPMERLFAHSGWVFEMFDVDVETASFRACSPSAIPLLGWAASKVPNHSPTLAQRGQASALQN
jgi:FkbM family methyltransferase